MALYRVICSLSFLLILSAALTPIDLSAQSMNPKKFMEAQKKYTKFVKKGEAFKQKGQLKKAIKFYTKAINTKAKDVSWAYTRRAMTYQEMKNYEGAIADYTKLIEIGKKPSNFYYHRAKVKAEAGDLKGAIDDINQAIKLSKAPLTYYLARAEFKSLGNDYDGALADCQLAINIQPTDGGSYWTRGNIKVRHGKATEACEDFNRSEEFGYQDAAKMIALYCKNYTEKYDVRAIPQATMNVDGNASDWSSIPVFMTGGAHNAKRKDTCDFDVQQVKFAQDGTNLYVLLEFTKPLEQCFAAQCKGTELVTLLFDNDNNRATGGEEQSYQLAGFEHRVMVSSQTRGEGANCTAFTSFSLDNYDDLKKLQRDPFTNKIPLTENNSPLIRQSGAVVELKIPLEKVTLPKTADKSFRVIFTEYENDGRSPFPSYYYGRL